MSPTMMRMTNRILVILQVPSQQSIKRQSQLLVSAKQTNLPAAREDRRRRR